MNARPHHTIPSTTAALSRLPEFYHVLAPVLAVVLMFSTVLVPARAAVDTLFTPSSIATTAFSSLDLAQASTNRLLPEATPQGIAAAPPAIDLLSATTPNTFTLRGPMSGRLRSFAFNRQQQGTIWALFDTASDVVRSGRGLVKSVDNGLTWTVLMKKEWNSLGFSRYLEIDPTNGNVLYADNMKSFDGGETWIQADTGVGQINELEIAPSDPNRLYARVGDTLFRSDDGSVSWQQITIPQPIVRGIVADPTNANTLYAFADDGGNCRYNPVQGTPVPPCLSVSTDSGMNWRTITPRIATSTATGDVYGAPLSVVVLPSATAGQPSVIYVATRGDSYRPESGGPPVPTGGVFRSVDGGASWVSVSSGLPREQNLENENYFTDYISMVGAGSGASVETNTLYLIASSNTVPFSDGTLYDSHHPRHSLYVTRNGGGSWQEVIPAGAGLGWQRVANLAVGPGTNGHRVFVTIEHRNLKTGGIADFLSGVFRSDDNGTSWQRSDEGLSNQRARWMIYGPDGLYAFVDGVGLIKSTDGGATWSFWSSYLTENNIVVNSIIWDPTDKQTVYIGTADRSILRSTNGGASFATLGLGLGNGEAYMLAVAPTMPRTLYAKKGTALLRSTDGGQSWPVVSGTPSGLGAFHLHPTNPQIIYSQSSPEFGGDTTHLKKSIDGGTSWTDLGNNADIFAIDPNNHNTLYRSSAPGATANEAREGFDVSTDAGATWATVEGAGYGEGRRLFAVLPTKPTILVSAIREASGLSYPVTRVEYSNDQGAIWLPMGNFVPNSLISVPGANNTLSLYSSGGAFTVGKATKRIRGDDMTVIVQEGRAGLWSYTFSPVPTEPPPLPSIEFTEANYSVAEAAGIFTVTARLSAPVQFETSVEYETEDGTATAGSDYTSTRGTLTFAPGETTKALGVPITKDTTGEANETVLLELTNPRRMTLGATAQATLTIIDGGAPPSINFATATYRGAESDRAITLTVSLSAPLGVPITVYYETANGTATSSDYTSTYGTLTFAPGETSKTVSVPIAADGQIEPDETFSVTLSRPTNATLGAINTTTVTIGDSTVLPTATATTVSPRRNSVYLPFVVGSGSGQVQPTPRPGEPTPTATRTPMPATATAIAANQPAQVGLAVSNVPAGTTQVKAVVTAADLGGPIAAEATANGASAALSLRVPPGRGRVIAVEAVGGAGVLARLTTIADLAGSTTPAIQVAFPATPPAVSCTAPTLSQPQAAHGKIIDLAGVVVPTTSQIVVIANGVPVLAFADAGGLHFALPPAFALPVGGKASLSLLVDGVPIACALPTVEILPLPPAPGENVRAVREVMGLLDDLAVLATDPAVAANAQPQAGQTFRALRDALQQQLSTLSNNGETDNADALLAQSGLLAQIRQLRASFAPKAAATTTNARTTSALAGPQLATLGNVEPLQNAKFADAQAVVKANQDLEGWRSVLGSDTYKQVMARLNLITFVLGFSPVPLANVGSLVAGIALTIFDFLANFFVSGSYRISRIDATPPEQRTVIGGGPTLQWAGGAVDVVRNDASIDALNVAGAIFNVIFPFAKNGGRQLIDQDALFGPLVSEALRTLVNTVFTAVFTPLPFLVERDTTSPGVFKIKLDPQTNVALGDLATVVTDVQDVVNIKPGNPGVIQSCTTSGSVLVRVRQNALEWVPTTTVREALFTLEFAPPSGNTPSPNTQCGTYTAVAGGGQHTLLVKKDGAVWAVGSNSFGQLGDGTTTNRDKPVQVLGLTDVIAVSAGLNHSLALKRDGTLWAWGRNTDGQVGNGATSNQLIPVQVLTDVLTMSAGERHTLAVKTDNTAWGWGHNGYGQLGLGNGTGARLLTPQRIANLANVSSVAAGRTHSLALTNDHLVFSWGYNGFGQLGDGTTNDAPVPVQVTRIDDVIAIAAGGLHSMALRRGGTVFAWGWNKYGQLGNGTSGNSKAFPIRLDQPTNVTAISAGYLHSVALAADGVIWSWGGNSSGQLGTGTKNNHMIPAKSVASFKDPVVIDAGAYYTVAATLSQQAWSWGQNSSYQLGQGSTAYPEIPGRVIQQ